VLPRREILALAITLATLAARDCTARPSANVSTEHKVAAVSAWVLHRAAKAHADTIVGNVARLLGMSNSDLNGRAAGFANERKDIFIFFMTFPDRSDVLLIRRDDKLDRRIYWRVKDGAFSTTVLGEDGMVAVVSGEVYDKSGMEILDLFYRASQT
jgi:hypothetical protein